MTLRNLFKRFNRKYFANRLNVSDIRFGRVAGKAYGETSFFVDCPPIITLAESLENQRRFSWMVLLHEMAHVDLGPECGHDEKFQKRMRKLVRQGAFDQLL
jgi:hypothetical protein